MLSKYDKISKGNRITLDRQDMKLKKQHLKHMIIYLNSLLGNPKNLMKLA